MQNISDDQTVSNNTVKELIILTHNLTHSTS